MKRKSDNDQERDNATRYMRLFLERWDAIALFLSAIAAEVLLILGIDSFGIPAETVALGVVLLVLSLLTYHILGQDTRISRLASHASMLEEKGIKRIYERRRDAFEDMHESIESAKRVFVANRYFSSFTEDRDMRRSIRNCLLREGTHVRILIYSPEGTHLDPEIETETTREDAVTWIEQSLGALKRFKQELPLDARNRFEYRILSGHIIYSSMIGMQDHVFLTPYLRDLAGNECPTLLCTQTTCEVDFFGIYKDEFEKMWELSIEYPS